MDSQGEQASKLSIINVKGHLVQRLLSKHKDTHTH